MGKIIMIINFSHNRAVLEKTVKNIHDKTYPNKDRNTYNALHLTVLLNCSSTTQATTRSRVRIPWE